MEICSIQNVSFSYRGQTKEILHSINLAVQEGEFVVICGQSGCGKTTLLRHLKPELKPYGQMSGCISFLGEDIHRLSPIESARKIGFVMQNPENQIVTDKVWHELAFGLENLGIPSKEIRRRVAEMATFFGIQDIFHEQCDQLSGGQKQILNLASIMLLQPQVLLLDEPTSQLDPIAATTFLETLKKINDEFGTTIIMVEHRLEEVLKLADQVVVMQDGYIQCKEPPYKIANKLNEIQIDHPMFEAFPTPVRLYHAITNQDPCPITVKEGKLFLKKHMQLHNTIKIASQKRTENVLLDMKDVYFRYEKDSKDILKGINFQIREHEICMLLGSNGAGKSTILNILCETLQPYRGSIVLFGQDILKKKHVPYLDHIAYIPQSVTSLFIKDSVEEDLQMFCKLQGAYSNAEERMQHWIKKLRLTPILTQHPYDLSGGEQQKVALCKVLMRNVKLLLLDEPTKGLDAFAKKEFGSILQELQQEGISVLMVSHDIEFAACYANDVALLFDGVIISQEEARPFFSHNHFYTTAAHKIAHNLNSDVITCEEVISLCQLSPI